MLPGFKTYCYDDRLSILCLPSQELRRLHIDLIMCYKIVFGSLLLTLNSTTSSNAVLLLQHVVMLSSCSKNM